MKVVTANKHYIFFAKISVHLMNAEKNGSILVLNFNVIDFDWYTALLNEKRKNEAFLICCLGIQQQ